MFTRSSKKKKMVARPATVTIVKPESRGAKKEPELDLSKATIRIVKPEPGLKVMVENTEGEDE